MYYHIVCPQYLAPLRTCLLILAVLSIFVSFTDDIILFPYNDSSSLHGKVTTALVFSCDLAR